MACDVLLSEVKVKRAQKEYDCIACLWVDALPRSELNEMLSFTEKRHWLTAVKNRFKILKGDPYVKQNQITDEGNFWVYRAIPAINDICYKYDLFEV